MIVFGIPNTNKGAGNHRSGYSYTVILNGKMHKGRLSGPTKIRNHDIGPIEPIDTKTNDATDIDADIGHCIGISFSVELVKGIYLVDFIFILG